MKRADLVKPVENEIITDPTERFIIGVNDFKQSAGYWYSVFALRVLPFLMFIIPVNVVLGRINRFLQGQFFPDIQLNKTPLLVMWIVFMVVFLAVAILSPKAATIIEFIVGFAYFFLTFRYHLYGSALGYFVLFAMIIFLLVKLVFLIFSLIRIKKFANEGNNIERDESGRPVRVVEEDVVFTRETDIDPETIKVDDDVYFVDNDLNEDNTPMTDNDFVF